MGETHSDSNSFPTGGAVTLSTQMDSVLSTLEVVSSYQPGRTDCSSTDPRSSKTSDLTDGSATDPISLIQSGLTDFVAKDPVSLIQPGLTDLAATDLVSSVHSDWTRSSSSQARRSEVPTGSSCVWFTPEITLGIYREYDRFTHSGCCKIAPSSLSK